MTQSVPNETIHHSVPVAEQNDFTHDAMVGQENDQLASVTQLFPEKPETALLQLNSVQKHDYALIIGNLNLQLRKREITIDEYLFAIRSTRKIAYQANHPQLEVVSRRRIELRSRDLDRLAEQE